MLLQSWACSSFAVRTSRSTVHARLSKVDWKYATHHSHTSFEVWYQCGFNLVLVRRCLEPCLLSWTRNLEVMLYSCELFFAETAIFTITKASIPSWHVPLACRYLPDMLSQHLSLWAQPSFWLSYTARWSNFQVVHVVKIDILQHSLFIYISLRWMSCSSNNLLLLSLALLAALRLVLNLSLVSVAFLCIVLKYFCMFVSWFIRSAQEDLSRFFFCCSLLFLNPLSACGSCCVCAWKETAEVS